VDDRVRRELLDLIGLDWAVLNISTLPRDQKSLKVNIYYRSSLGPLHLLLDSTGINVEGEYFHNLKSKRMRFKSPFNETSKSPQSKNTEKIKGSVTTAYPVGNS